MIAIVVVAVVGLSGGSPSPAAPPGTKATEGPAASDPNSAAQQYLASFAAGDTDSAGQLTDDPQACSAALRDARHTLRPTEIQATLGTVGPVAGSNGDTASAAYTATWTLGAEHVWTYHGTFDLVSSGGTWRVHWTPAVLHPTLGAGQRLALVTATPDQPAVLDKDGTPLVITGAAGTRLADPTNFALLRDALVGQVTPPPNVFAVERVDTAGNNLQTLFGTTGSQLKPRTSTLSAAVQSAAQSVVNGYSGPAVIVALQPSDGGLLAVARNAQSISSPLSGLYAPGSTFKIVTATAALEDGITTINSTLDCPLTAQIGTRTISNEGFGLGTITMHEAFAKSCNTTFGQLASQLPADGLANTADQYGLNADFTIPGLSTQTGKVVPAADSDEQVEDGIGQGTVQVSPFGEALMAATVAAGHPVTPRLWQDADTGVVTGYTAPPASVLTSLRTMMREVVTSGTATGLADSGLVYGKTGTAQFGSGTQAHGWFVGYRGDIAFAVLLEDANDSRPAVTLAAQFLAAVK
jgi:beta-lactamase class D